MESHWATETTWTMFCWRVHITVSDLRQMTVGNKKWDHCELSVDGGVSSDYFLIVVLKNMNSIIYWFSFSFSFLEKDSQRKALYALGIKLSDTSMKHVESHPQHNYHISVNFGSLFCSPCLLDSCRRTLHSSILFFVTPAGTECFKFFMLTSYK